MKIFDHLILERIATKDFFGAAELLAAELGRPEIVQAANTCLNKDEIWDNPSAPITLHPWIEARTESEFIVWRPGEVSAMKWRSIYSSPPPYFSVYFCS